MIARVAINALALLVLPFLLTGVINWTKSRWSGRRGPPLLQSAYDVARLLRKSSVYSATTTPLFRAAPWVFLCAALGAAGVTPLLASAPAVAFPFDFVWFAYALGLGRLSLGLAALDTGSAFEGMGAAREATFSTLLEPTLFMVFGALSLLAGTSSLGPALAQSFQRDAASNVIGSCSVVALLIALQVECSRMPVDDPTTHLELTMIHEVMVLDHSGPDLAAIQYGSAVKLLTGIALVATLLNPFAGHTTFTAVAVQLSLCLVLAVMLGTIESLFARLKLRSVPKYIALALSCGTIALLGTAWRGGSP